MAATVWNRDFWEQSRDGNPYLYSSPNWLVWEALNRLEVEGVRVISARMSRGYAVRVKTADGERMVKVL
jgi:hypothetical protein